MPSAPIQVVLNTDSFHVARERDGGGGHTDFFPYREEEFIQHQRALIQQVTQVKEALELQPDTQIGIAKVHLRKAALAKSHRPSKEIFRASSTPVLGVQHFGDLLIQVSPNSLEQVLQEISRAESETRVKTNPKSRKEEPNPSRRKSEVGAIERIDLYSQADKRSFSAEQAVRWLSDPRTGGIYHIDLFKLPPPHDTWDLLEEFPEELSLFSSFIELLNKLGPGVTVRLLSSPTNPRPTLGVWLDRSTADPYIQIRTTFRPGRSGRSAHELSLDVQRHEKLLQTIEQHPLVRTIRLPGWFEPSGQDIRSMPVDFRIPAFPEGQRLPKVGVIDGGIAAVLSEWITGSWDLIAPEDEDLSHGTFIGGLLVAGEPLNGLEVVLERQSCELINIAVLPKEGDPNVFGRYFPNGVVDFLDEVELAIAECRSKYGVRIFNFSLNMPTLVSLDDYSVEAARLDQISDEHDVLIFISAGNAKGTRARDEWPLNPVRALSHLASARGDGIEVPAESVRNVSVAALNPPGVPGAIAHAPARYSRRGPGPGSGVKPDLSHVGGSGTPHMLAETGLYSIDPTGAIASSSGTSFATPLVAKTAAILAANIEGEVSRETLKALLVHYASLPIPLQNPLFQDVARHLVGFGMPSSTQDILEGQEHQITLVFASRLMPKQELKFDFQWPASLVSPEGKCRGDVRQTLVYTPPLDYSFGAEFVRVSLEASLQQENGRTPDGKPTYKREVHPTYLPKDESEPHYEADLVTHGLKWSPIKVYQRNSKQGFGKSSTWRLVVSYLTRAEAKVPVTGIPFSLILTVGDPDKERDIFNTMRQSLQTLGATLSDIRTAARVTPRI